MTRDDAVEQTQAGYAQAKFADAGAGTPEANAHTSLVHPAGLTVRKELKGD